MAEDDAKSQHTQAESPGNGGPSVDTATQDHANGVSTPKEDSSVMNKQSAEGPEKSNESMNTNDNKKEEPSREKGDESEKEKVSDPEKRPEAPKDPVTSPKKESESPTSPVTELGKPDEPEKVAEKEPEDRTKEKVDEKVGQAEKGATDAPAEQPAEPVSSNKERSEEKVVDSVIPPVTNGKEASRPVDTDVQDAEMKEAEREEVVEPKTERVSESREKTPESENTTPEDTAGRTQSTTVDSVLTKSRAEIRAKVTIYDEDAGVIRCICGFDDDDGFTIQCERCNAWQHAQCMDISEEQVPETYYCEQCDENEHRTVDVDMAKERQKQRLALEHQPDAEQPNEVPNHRAIRRKKKPGKSKSQDFDSKDDAATDQPDITNDAAAPQANGPKRSRGKSRLTVQDSKSNGADDNKDQESDSDVDHSRYFVSASVYKSFFVRVESLLTEPSMDDYLQTKGIDWCKEDDSCSFLGTQEYASIKPIRASVRFTSDNLKNKFYGFSKFGLYSEVSAPRDRYVIEFVGKAMPIDDYKSNRINQYKHFGCPKPGVLFHAGIGIAIDGRCFGSEAAFIRRSCTPTVKFSPVVVGGKSLHFAAFALEQLRPGTELTMAWEWDPRHPASKLESEDEDSIELGKAERECLLATAQMLADRGVDCACNLGQDCILMKMKRLGSRGANFRTTRNGNQERSEAGNPSVGYSAREERKLQGAMELIDKLEQQQNKRKRKSVDTDRKEEDLEETNEAEESIDSVEHQVKKVRTEEQDTEDPVESTSPGSVASPAPIKIPLTKRQYLFERFMQAKKLHLQNPPSRAQSNSPGPLPLSFSFPMFGTKLVPTPLPSPGDVKSSQTAAATTPATAPAPAGMAAGPGPATGAVAPQSSAIPKGPKKKLSFADYKKKQRPAT